MSLQQRSVGTNEQRNGHPHIAEMLSAIAWMRRLLDALRPLSDTFEGAVVLVALGGAVALGALANRSVGSFVALGAITFRSSSSSESESATWAD